MILTVEKLNSFYSLSHILFDVGLELNKGEIVCLLGRNGAGKTTTLKSIMGLVNPASGKVVFQGENITGKAPFVISRKGIGYVPENRIIFPNLTVKENLLLPFKNSKLQTKWSLEKAYNIFPILHNRQKQSAGTLSGGEQQMLTIARTMMTNPDMLLLDEPSEGLAPIIVEVIEQQIVQLNKQEGITILVCEQNLTSALRVSHRAYVMEKGQIKWTGAVDELKASPEVMKKYMGV
ncbi:MAG: ABC transporter ATP-binding protein [Desulfomonile tiedjei]|nr:ABC transporter ATP-binding protein [Desulfomonile tiedjei]